MKDHKHHDCCGDHHAHHQHDEHAQHAHAHHGHPGGSSLSLATHATLHCLTGCAIGELAGLMIGVSLGLAAGWTIALATVLGFASGYTLGLWPLVKQGSSWLGAFRTIWLGETVSIAVMELVMNLTDYHVGACKLHQYCICNSGWAILPHCRRGLLRRGR
jgi:hypothetical protein